MDIVKEFLEDQCDLDPNATINPTELFNVFKLWCTTRGEKSLPPNVFGERLEGKGLPPGRSNSLGRFRRGLRLKNPPSAESTASTASAA